MSDIFLNYSLFLGTGSLLNLDLTNPPDGLAMSSREQPTSASSVLVLQCVYSVCTVCVRCVSSLLTRYMGRDPNAGPCLFVWMANI